MAAVVAVSVRVWPGVIEGTGCPGDATAARFSGVAGNTPALSIFSFGKYTIAYVPSPVLRVKKISRSGPATIEVRQTLLVPNPESLTCDFVFVPRSVFETDTVATELKSPAMALAEPCTQSARLDNVLTKIASMPGNRRRCLVEHALQLLTVLRQRASLIKRQPSDLVRLRADLRFARRVGGQQIAQI